MTLENGSTIKLYQDRLKQKLEGNVIQENEGMEESWQKVKQSILRATKEAIGTHKARSTYSKAKLQAMVYPRSQRNSNTKERSLPKIQIDEHLRR